MDRLIKTALRAFWVGLGAAAVLVSQSVLTPSPSPTPSPADPAAAPLVAPRPLQSPAALRRQAADPILSDSKTNPLNPHCETVADVTRCS